MTLRNLARWSALLTFITAAGARAQSSALQPPQLPEDKYLWLEDVSSSRATEWVNAESARSSSHFEADPRFAADYADALRVLDDPDKLVVPGLKGDRFTTTGATKITREVSTAGPRWQTT